MYSKNRMFIKAVAEIIKQYRLKITKFTEYLSLLRICCRNSSSPLKYHSKQ